ncbi:hypothetical protein ASG48_05075 [Aurantimonas sp. Leaf443]|nr:hypothetical protein ASG48_05075 [Aurantimonas sp. Leaf443]
MVAGLAAETGKDPQTLVKAIGHILAFIRDEAEDPEAAPMIAATPGAGEAIAAAEAGGGGGGFFGSLMGGGIMGLGMKLMGLGLDMGEIRLVATSLMDHAKAHAGEDVVNRVASSVPGLADYV